MASAIENSIVMRRFWTASNASSQIGYPQTSAATPAATRQPTAVPSGLRKIPTNAVMTPMRASSTEDTEPRSLIGDPTRTESGDFLATRSSRVPGMLAMLRESHLTPYG